MLTATRTRVKVKVCRTPDCFTEVPEMDVRFCPPCQARLDRVRDSLASDSRDSRGQRNGYMKVPSVSSLTPSKAVAFEKGLARRAGDGRTLSEHERLTRTVRIIQLQREGKTAEAITSRLFLDPNETIEREVAWYREQQLAAAQKSNHGPRRDVALEKTIVALAQEGTKSRAEIAAAVDMTESALAMKLSRLRDQGHEIPDARTLKKKVTA